MMYDQIDAQQFGAVSGHSTTHDTGMIHLWNMYSDNNKSQCSKSKQLLCCLLYTSDAADE